MTTAGIGYDIHRFAKGRRLVVGGVTIPGAQGLIGHSDADVLAHAVTDALLGAAGDGDIGMHFPDTDPVWKDADSLAMLGAVATRLRRRGLRAAHADATVVAQAPKLAPYREAMRRNLARAMGLDRRRVNVKATTPEGLGALGRREGMAALAVVTVANSAKGLSRRRGRRVAGR
jgi:2-C-methyl-D-erythritol 2,4-cyclodiphosphate synthase